MYLFSFGIKGRSLRAGDSLSLPFSFSRKVCIRLRTSVLLNILFKLPMKPSILVNFFEDG